MSYVLYSRNSTGGYAVEAALAKAGAAYEVVEISRDTGGADNADFLAISPLRQVPAMRLPDGTAMTESAAMVIHIAAVYPDAGLAPRPGTSAHARFLRWMLFMACNIYEADLRHYYSDRYSSDPAGAAGVKEAAAAHMRRSLDIVESELSPYLLGKEMSIADVYLAMLLTWFPYPILQPRLRALVTDVSGHAVYGPIWRAHGMTT